MLLAVEGGGFFSSSASGYSKGLALLLLGQKTEDKPMKVTPWSHCPPEEQQQQQQQQQQRGGRGFVAEIQLAPENKGVLRGGCTSLSCFGCASTGLESESPSAQKAGPTKSQDQIRSVHDSVVERDEDEVVGVKSNSKKSINGDLTGDVIEHDVGGNRETFGIHQSSNESESESSALDAENGEGCRNINENGESFEEDCSNDSACQVIQRRKVQWMDSIGGELFEIREFEMSDDSDDEFGHGNEKCMCVIM